MSGFDFINSIRPLRPDIKILLMSACETNGQDLVTILEGGRYGLTAMGRIMQRIMAIIEYSADNQYKLKAIDSLELSGELPANEMGTMIGRLIENEEIKHLLSAGNGS